MTESMWSEHMKGQSKFLIRIFTTLCVGAFFVAPVEAQQNSGYGDEWQHAIAIYGWGVDIGGQLALGNRNGDVSASGTGIDVGYEDLLDGLDFAFMGSYQASKGRWLVLADVMYADLSGNEQLDLIPPIGGDLINVTTDASLDIKGLVFHLGGGYNLYKRENTATDFVFGTRYLGLSSDLVLDFHLGPPGLEYRLPISVSEDLLDAFIGLKGTIGLSDRWLISYYGDIGAGDSEFSWQAEAGIVFKAAHWASIGLVYRHLAWDIGGKVLDDLSIRGPALGVVFRF